MTDIDYSSTYDFTLDPFVENNKVDNREADELNNNTDDNNIKNENQTNINNKKNGMPSGQGCKIFFIVIFYLVIKELGLSEKILDTGIKKAIFIILLWMFGYDLVNNVIGFDKNVCLYLF